MPPLHTSFGNIVIPYSQACTESSPRASQPHHLLVPLRQHQLAVIERMNTLEQQLHDGMEIHEGTERLYGRFGVLGDPSGAGKSLMVLGHISACLQRPQLIQTHTLHPNSYQNLYSLIQEEVRDLSNCSALLIVPHMLFHQWSKLLQEQTTLRSLLLKSKENLLQTGFFSKLFSAEVVLVSNTLLKEFLFLTNHGGVRFSRIYIDEADTISIPPMLLQMPDIGFLWFVTAAWKNIIFSNRRIWIPQTSLGDLIASPEFPLFDTDFQTELMTRHSIGQGYLIACPCKSDAFYDSYLRGEHPHKSYVVVRCSNTFLRQSIPVPQITTEQFVCTRPGALHLALAFLTPDMQEMLNVENTANVYTHLGIPTSTPSALLRTLTNGKMADLETARREYTFKSAMDYDTVAAKEAALTPSLTKIRGIEEQMDTLRNRLENYAHEPCPICYEEKGTSALVTPCCSRIFCASCLLQALSKIGTCPLCRTVLAPNTLVSVSAVPPSTGDGGGCGGRNLKPFPKQVTKHEMLAKLLREHPTEKFLVFSHYEGTFPYLQKYLSEEGFPARELKGNMNILQHILKEFETGSLRVLLLKEMTGLAFPSATGVVLWHTIYQEHTILERLRRVGNGRPLRLVRLVYPEEIALSIAH